MRPTPPVLRRIFLAAIGALSAAFGGGCSKEPNVALPISINFDSAEIGALPPDFSTALTGGGGPVAWAVREDSTAPGGPRVLVQESADDTSYRFPLCLYEKTMPSAVAVEVRYKALAGKVDQAGGLVLRYHPENYYIARANALEDNIDLFKTVDGKRLKIQEVDCKVTPGAWHVLRFTAQGSHLEVAFDGQTMISTEDATFSRAGKVGLWTKADSVSAFANLKIVRAP